MIDRLNLEIFDFSEAFRSERVARTEAGSASNQGHIDAYRQADVSSKRWLAAIDGRTREDHLEAHGQVVERVDDDHNAHLKVRLDAADLSRFEKRRGKSGG